MARSLALSGRGSGEGSGLFAKAGGLGVSELSSSLAGRVTASTVSADSSLSVVLAMALVSDSGLASVLTGSGLAATFCSGFCSGSAAIACSG
ncbi:MAG: Uncharacterised protein [Marinobacterium sp. xm-d-530]|nr:MAG: Uncharacterised protein [Marinobacterium sp. xm-d-530]